MEPLFGRDGRCVAWLSDDVVYGVGGRALAFVRQGNVIDFAGRHFWASLTMDGFATTAATPWLSAPAPGRGLSSRSAALRRSVQSGPLRRSVRLHLYRPVRGVRRPSWSPHSFPSWLVRAT